MANNPTDDFLLTKLHPPAPPAQLVPRPRLRQRLAEGLAGPLTLVTAPAGSGKTTLLAERAAQRQPPLAWLALDERDNDPIRFWSYLIAALQTLDPHLGEQALALLRTPQPPDPAVVLTLLINSIQRAGTKVILVLDDCQHIVNEQLYEGLAFLTAHRPAGMHLALLSRATPPLPLAPLLAHGQLTVIDGEALRFTPDEASQFLRRALGAPAPPESLAQLAAQAEGWAAGLQLAASAFRAAGQPPRGLSGGRKLIHEFLAEEVIQRQPEAVQSFLLHTALLDRLSGPLCQAVAGCDDGQAMLAQLESANLFITPLDAERRWFRYQPLFSDSLRRLARARLDVAELHRRASVWFEQNDSLSEAIEHALAAGEAARAANLIEPAAEAAMRRGETATLLRWLRALPDALVRARPGLCLWFGWCQALAGAPTSAEDYLQALERLGAGRRGRRDPAARCQQARAQELAGQAAVIRSLLALNAGRWSEARACSRRALARLPANDARLRGLVARNLGVIALARGELADAEQASLQACRDSQADGHFFIQLASLQQLAQVRLRQGRLADAEQTAGQALALAAEQDMRLLAREAVLTLAVAAYERNQLPAALAQADEALALARLAGAPAGICEALLIRAGVQQALGNSAAADEGLAQARQAAQAADAPTARWVEAWQARLWLLQGRTELALDWAQPAGPLDTNHRDATAVFARLTQARLLLARGQWPAAIEVLRAVRRRALAVGRRRDALEALIVLALAQQAGGQRGPALASLRQALVLAEPAGYARLFLDDGPALRELLGRLATTLARQRSPLSEFVHALLRQISPPGAAPSAGELLDPLTEGEAQVLGWLARGLSNRAIAGELMLAQSTVEWHLKNIYSKLAVHSRTQAVAQARALKLIG